MKKICLSFVLLTASAANSMHLTYSKPNSKLISPPNEVVGYWFRSQGGTSAVIIQDASLRGCEIAQQKFPGIDLLNLAQTVFKNKGEMNCVVEALPEISGNQPALALEIKETAN